MGEAIDILPRNMLYSTDINVTLRISAGNQQNGKTVKLRNREAQQETIYANSAHTKNDVSSLKNPTMYPLHNTDTYNSFRSLILRKTKI
ncbi:putative type I restriction-modification system M subunit [Prevotella sp. CAG:924]|nr:putative type I restriction-modification system M subunit [Prevotella sp. CAG:924]